MYLHYDRFNALHHEAIKELHKIIQGLKARINVLENKCRQHIKGLNRINITIDNSDLINRKISIKILIMNQNIVVGVGNIYANEALFLSHINQLRPSDSLSKKEVALLTQNIKKVLVQAIKKGGTTLNDFKNTEGKPGYFKQELFVYGRKNKPCLICANPIQECRIGQRSTFYCPKCQKL